ncbi:type IV toxin-antitoxin system AbiEi family antitoxin [Phycicoccus sp. MAQZ13P-2]|nr:type IV toxin-antitoxin system AbiEi family antitoxin [Phycicoccus mangrovi]MBT9275107.1 type IV toxin-antitoxin system AbiEi family antitoxin [Phycicoccus mangrovi]
MATMRRPGLPTEFARAALRTVRARDVTVYAHPRTQLARLEQAGLLHRLADGYFAVVPSDRVGEGWRPTVEAAAAGVAAADFGARGFALMGVSAARLHHVLPRAVGIAVVAAPRRRAPVTLADRDATVRFLVRDLALMHLEVLESDLGRCLVTTPEQTLLDLAHRPRQDGLPEEVDAAVRALAPRCDPDLVAEVADGQRLGRALDRLRRQGLLS